jgi:hypothetical protein
MRGGGSHATQRAKGAACLRGAPSLGTLPRNLNAACPSSRQIWEISTLDQLRLTSSQPSPSNFRFCERLSSSSKKTVLYLDYSDNRIIA